MEAPVEKEIIFYPLCPYCAESNTAKEHLVFTKRKQFAMTCSACAKLFVYTAVIGVNVSSGACQQPKEVAA